MVLLLAPAYARGDERHLVRPGALCQPVEGSADSVDYDHKGVFNIASAPAAVHCPLPGWNTGEQVDQIAVVVYDQSSSANIECTVRATNFKGETQFSNKKNTTGGGPGTPFSVLLFRPTTVPLGWFWTVQCELPAQESGSFSRVGFLKIQTQF